MSDSSVKVAVRVRPFNAREQSEGAELCVEMDGKLTRLREKQTGRTKDFYFDYSYWSHDGFRVDDQTGIMFKDSPSSQYADQKTVFDDLGIGVLDNAWEGYHCCLFAYGAGAVNPYLAFDTLDDLILRGRLGDDATLELESELGTTRIEATTALNTFKIMGKEEGVPVDFNLHQGGARYSMDGMTAYGMIERSSTGDMLTG